MCLRSQVHAEKMKPRSSHDGSCDAQLCNVPKPNSHTGPNAHEMCAKRVSEGIRVPPARGTSQVLSERIVNRIADVMVLSARDTSDNREWVSLPTVHMEITGDNGCEDATCRTTLRIGIAKWTNFWGGLERVRILPRMDPCLDQWRGPSGFCRVSSRFFLGVTAPLVLLATSVF